VHVRPYERRDREAVLALADRLKEGVAPWRSPQAVRDAVRGWVRDALDAADDRGRAVFVADEDGAVVGFVTAATRKHFAGDVDCYVGELVVDRRADYASLGYEEEDVRLAKSLDA
jgi:hypothetical protein